MSEDEVPSFDNSMKKKKKKSTTKVEEPGKADKTPKSPPAEESKVKSEKKEKKENKEKEVVEEKKEKKERKDKEEKVKKVKKVEEDEEEEVVDKKEKKSKKSKSKDEEEEEEEEVEKEVKKSKKSKKPKDDEDEEDEEEEETKKTKKSSKDEGEDEEEPEDPDEPQDFLKGKKKKKNKVPLPLPEDQEVGEEIVIGEEDTSAPAEEKVPWAGSDRDYSYEELAGRIYSLLHTQNPALAGKGKRYVMKPPMLNRIGTKKTAWSNFVEICKLLNRKPEHFMSYVMTELGTNGSIDGSLSLVIKGRFQPKQIENVIRHYISEYVACRMCKSPETLLQKENRLYFLVCQSCGSKRSVAAIKKGFEAQIGKRKKEDK